jgi:hypothetical protein
MNRRAALVGVAFLTNAACRGRSPRVAWPFTGVPAERLAPPANWYESVSLVELICERERFDEKPVRVTGFGHLEFEGTALYLHRDDSDMLVTMNSVALDVPDSDPEFTRWNDRYVVVAGVFKAWSRGPGSASLRSGIIEQISQYDPRPTREERRRASARLEREAEERRRRTRS